MRISRERYAALYGPTVGDRVRLADTDLWLEVDEDRCAGGDEAVFGGGKTIRESMLQGIEVERAPDTVITNVVVLDHWGVVKCDVGIKDGRICALGKAGNPDVMDGVDPALEIGPTTEIIAGEGRILTAGAIDGHVHFICPQIVDEAVAAGVTTLIGGGTGPAEGTRAVERRASDELAASGARLGHRQLSGPESLTPAELRVSRLAAEGLSNREIAQTLFVTQKTVETHLAHAYDKLAIKSRRELTAALV